MIRSVLNGLVGACTLTIAHQLLRKVVPDAPRMDKLGQEGISKITKAVNIKLSEKDEKRLALVGDLVSNTIYFSQVGNKAGFLSLLRGVSLGSAAGAGSAVLPGKLKLDSSATNKTMRTKVMAVSLYVLAGLAAGMAAQAGGRRK